MKDTLRKGKGRIESWFYNLRIQIKFLMSYMIITVLILIIGIGLSYFNVAQFYTRQIETVSENTFSQALNSLESLVRNNLYAAYIIQNSEEIQAIFTDSQKDIMEQYEEMKKIRNYVFSVGAPLSIYQIAIYVPNERVYSDNNIYFRKFSELEQYDTFQKLAGGSDIYVWMETETITGDNLSDKVLVNSILRKIGDTANPVGYQRVSIRNSTLASLTEEGKYVETGTVFLYDTLYNEVISPIEDERIQSIVSELSMDSVKVMEYQAWKSATVGGEKQLIRMERIRSTDWVLVSMYPERYLDSAVMKQYLIWFFAFIAVGGFSVLLAYVLSRSLTGRIKMLDEHMTELALGKGVPIDGYEGKDEIGNLIQNYNITLGRITEYMEKIVKDGQKMRLSELKLLQSQINPHFLYNTLDLIHWEALDHDVPLISDITQTLAQFYRLSLNQGKEMVSIKEEINHVISYMEIQNYRYGNKISMDILIPEKIMKYQIIKITLQPLVENAIQHGLRNKNSLDGAAITIDGWIEENYIYLQVTDNGIGISDDQLEGILESKISDDMHGFGIHNIQERLQIQYGLDCGLQYESKLGYGTTVTVKIKAEKCEE